jgi:hypothetical protein
VALTPPRPTRRFICARWSTPSTVSGYNYFVIEAFDQPWKASDEGSVGAYWGVYNAARQQKFNFEGPVVAIPQWRVLAIGSVVMGTAVAGIAADRRLVPCASVAAPS